MCEPLDDHVNRLHAEFRKIGFTRRAIENKRSQAGFEWICAFNGCKPEQAPWQFRYASNPVMLDYVERQANSR